MILGTAPLPGDLVFVRGVSPLAWLIRTVSKADYSHVRLYVGCSQVVESVPPSVSNGLVNRGDVFVRLPFLAPDQRRSLVAAARADVGVVRYSRLSFIGDLLRYAFGWHVSIDSDDAFNCAEWIAFRLGHIDYRNLSPGALYDRVIALGAQVLPQPA